jgi:hypothetical protein
MFQNKLIILSGHVLKWPRYYGNVKHKGEGIAKIRSCVRQQERERELPNFINALACVL